MQQVTGTTGVRRGAAMARARPLADRCMAVCA
ncbi:hypothetical protein BPA30113_04561 [Burkholderia paludis]|uniref:Uncharacterized protein n=1 Tax=Burkholderia paludis TaxID=1506587 RepID=A0A6J5D6K2_9BURK|nr:hypothetical protein LMG30113_00702 [Burkholderia paludis]VWB97569.1 hypothetical protein BPA30113_04561 [Burkholderia paludis]